MHGGAERGALAYRMMRAAARAERAMPSRVVITVNPREKVRCMGLLS
jgi:hypothetical protein